MRTYVQMMDDYLKWYVKKTGDKSYNPTVYFGIQDEEKLNIRKATIWNEMLRLCYKPTEGIYWFDKFILGDMKYAGYPSAIHFNYLWWWLTKLTQDGDHIAIKCPRQHGKSTYWTAIQP